MNSYTPFKESVMISLKEWEELPNSIELVKRWNMRLKLRAIQQTERKGKISMEEHNTRLPYKSSVKTPGMMIVDRIYYDMVTKLC